MPDDQQFTFAYGVDGLVIEGKDGENIVLEVPWSFLPAFARIVAGFDAAREAVKPRP